ncbi:hypothetical protein THAOC_02537 [Thalassiosira oceanica]|uniref:Uncharacterized protein n=1 Tax=Thalassiosira oceanica TaxID=159749 RepID=K0TQB0_THAOC|nr:hypothetical protein THAOC_02537 [Thalassiosira oceanica]|eukprot:EJK75732.1 hypothetical protein THAOC_02537 [Thalassiosira oceanica]
MLGQLGRCVSRVLPPGGDPISEGHKAVEGRRMRAAATQPAHSPDDLGGLLEVPPAGGGAFPEPALEAVPTVETTVAVHRCFGGSVRWPRLPGPSGPPAVPSGRGRPTRRLVVVVSSWDESGSSTT